MKALYFASNAVLADGLKRQLVWMSPPVDLDVSLRADEAQVLLMSSDVDAVLIDTGLPDEATSGLLAAIRQHNLPLVVIVAAASAARTSAFWALQADFVWGCDGDTGYPLSPERFAPEVSVAIRHAAQRHRATNPLRADPIRVVYVGNDEQVRGVLGVTPAMYLTNADDPASHVAVIDAAPYDAIQSVRALRAVAPALPIVLLFAADVQGADDIAYVLGVDRVVVKSDQWLPELITMLQTMAETRHMAAHGGRDHSKGQVHDGDLERSLPTPTYIDARDVEAERAEWHARLEVITAHQQQELGIHQAQRNELQRQLDDTRAAEARVTSTIEAERAEWAVRLEAATAQQQQEFAAHEARCDELRQTLARDRAQRDEMAVKLKVTLGQLRRAGRLSELAAGVVGDLDGFLSENAAKPASAEEQAAPFGDQSARARQAAERARGLARRFLAFLRTRVEPPEPTDLGGLIRDVAPTLQQLVGSGNELLLRLDSVPTPVLLSHQQLRRLLFSLAVLCGDALPIGGQVLVEATNVEAIPSWDADVPHVEASFVRMTVTVSGHAPTPMPVTPAIESLVQECDGHYDAVSTADASTGLRIYLPRHAGAQQE